MAEQTMWAVISAENGPYVTKVAKPAPQAGQVLVRVIGAGVNRADLAAGLSVPARAIGMEWSGEIVALGAGVSTFALGELVMCSGNGGYGEFAVADAARTISLAGIGIAADQAAVLPLALMTAHDAVIGKGALCAGESLLVQGASSGIGLMCLRIAAWRGATAILASARTPERRTLLHAFGATHSLDPAGEDMVAQCLSATQGQGAGLVVDMLGGATLNTTMQMTAIGGRIINVGRLAGNTTPDFNCDLHAARQLQYLGVTFRSRTPAQIAQIVRDMLADLHVPLSQGKLELPIYATFELAKIAEAHALMRSNQHFGKILLRI